MHGSYWNFAWRTARLASSRKTSFHSRKVEPDQEVVLWHMVQSVGNPAATWLGLVALL